jgi:hypothetical protein
MHALTAVRCDSVIRAAQLVSVTGRVATKILPCVCFLIIKGCKPATMPVLLSKNAPHPDGGVRAWGADPAPPADGFPIPDPTPSPARQPDEPPRRWSMGKPDEPLPRPARKWLTGASSGQAPGGLPSTPHARLPVPSLLHLWPTMSHRAAHTAQPGQVWHKIHHKKEQSNLRLACRA